MAGGRCTSLAPNADVAEKCCTHNESALHVGLLAQLAKIDQEPMDQVFAPLAVRDAIRRVGLQPPMKRSFGEEQQYALDMKIGKRKGSGVKVDLFGTAAMGMWQIPAQFECLMRALHDDLGSRLRRSVCVGTWSGWTDLVMTAYMQKLNPQAQHSTFDIADHVSPCIKALHKSRRVQQVRNGWYGGKESWRPLGMLTQWDGQYPANWSAPVIDFCLIDGGHSFYLAHRDFRTLRTACRVIAFHDVHNAAVGWDAVPRLWRSLTNPEHRLYAPEFSARNCTMQPVGGSGFEMGIGVLTRREAAA